MGDTSERTRVLVVGGWGRCGSTLLDMMLGQIEGFVSAGEVRELWLRGCVEDRPCGCGEPFSRCRFWSAVGEEAFGGWERLDLDTILRVRFHWDRPWQLPRLLRAWGPVRDAELATYVDALGRLLAAIARVAGASVVIDSSKLPTHTLLLVRNPDLDVRMVHLVRDSRGVAFSNQKTVVKTVTSGEPTLLPQYGAMSSALRYDLYNTLNGLLDGKPDLAWMWLRYEDLVADPEARLRQVAAHAQPGVQHELPFLHDRQVTLGSNHLVDGNPVRFTRDALTLSLDDEWRRRLSARDRRTMTLLTWPLMHHYAYPRR